MPTKYSPSDMKTVFQVHSNKGYSNSHSTNVISHPELYPDFKIDHSNTMYLAMGSYDLGTYKEILTENQELIEETLFPIFSQRPCLRQGATDILKAGSMVASPYDHLSLYAKYIGGNVMALFPLSRIYDSIRSKATSDVDYDFYRNIQSFMFISTYTVLNDHKFDIVTKANTKFDATKAGMAALTDGAGKISYMRVGKAIRKMFPNLPTSLITHMTEAIKDHYDKTNVDLYVHEGFDAKHFAYAYQHQIGTETNPSLRGQYSSLHSSCLRGEVNNPEMGYGNGERRNMLITVWKTGVHPAEAYASGDFSVAYVTDKPDPFDKSAKVHSRVNIAHFEIDKSKLDMTKYVDVDDYVNIGKIYIVSEAARAYMDNYLEDKYKFLSYKNTYMNYNPYITMENCYRIKSNSNISTESEMTDAARKNLRDAVVRHVRMLAIDAKGKPIEYSNESRYLTTGEQNVDYTGQLKLIAPYLDFSDDIESTHLVLVDFNGNVPSASSNPKQIYLALVGSYMQNKSTFVYNSRFSNYNGYNYVRALIEILKCHVTGKSVKSTQGKLVDIYVHGRISAEQVFVSNAACDNTSHAKGTRFFKYGNQNIIWNIIDKDSKNARLQYFNGMSYDMGNQQYNVYHTENWDVPEECVDVVFKGREIFNCPSKGRWIADRSLADHQVQLIDQFLADYNNPQSVAPQVALAS